MGRVERKILRLFEAGNGMKKIILFGVAFYKAAISPILDAIFGNGMVCRFTPTCSEYMVHAVNKYGALKGFNLGIKRILRCHPLSKGGHDPVR